MALGRDRSRICARSYSAIMPWTAASVIFGARYGVGIVSGGGIGQRMVGYLGSGSGWIRTADVASAADRAAAPDPAAAGWRRRTLVLDDPLSGRVYPVPAQLDERRVWLASCSPPSAARRRLSVDRGGLHRSRPSGGSAPTARIFSGLGSRTLSIEGEGRGVDWTLRSWCAAQPLPRASPRTPAGRLTCVIVIPSAAARARGVDWWGS